MTTPSEPAPNPPSRAVSSAIEKMRSTVALLVRLTGTPLPDLQVATGMPVDAISRVLADPTCQPGDVTVLVAVHRHLAKRYGYEPIAAATDTRCDRVATVQLEALEGTPAGSVLLRAVKCPGVGAGSWLVWN